MLRGARLLLAVLSALGVGQRVASQSQSYAQESVQRGSGTSSAASAQQPGIQSVAGHLSEPHHQVWAPEVFRSTGHQPTWAYGYLAQLKEEGSPGQPNAEVYDREGRLISEPRLWLPDALQIMLFDAAPSASGGVVASGNAETMEGTTYFLAKTDVSGEVVSLLRTGTTVAGHVCEAGDGTIWTFETDVLKESANEQNYSLVQQYSFEKGLLHSYLSRELVALKHIGSPGGSSILVCGKKHISLYLMQINEYIEIDPATESLQRWEMDMTPLPHARVTGLVVTESGHIYASLYEVQTETERKTHGLFELQTEQGNPTAKWAAIRGTLNTHLEGEPVPKDTFWRLWGSEGNDLIIGRQYDAEFSWVQVIR
jgi:hypothetical protein